MRGKLRVKKLTGTGFLGFFLLIAVILYPRFISATVEDFRAFLIAQNGGDSVTVNDFKSFNAEVNSLAVSPDNKLLLVATRDGLITAIDLATSEAIYSSSSSLNPRYITISNDGQYFAAALGNKIGLFNLENGQRIRQWTGHFGKIQQLAISPDNKYIISISSVETTARIWDFDTGKEVRTIGIDQGFLTALAFSPDGNSLAAASSSQDRTIRIWSVDTWEVSQRTTQQIGNIYDVLITPDSTKLVAAIRNLIIVWDWQTIQELYSVNVDDLDINAIAISPNSKWVAIAERKGTISLLNLDTRKTMKISGHQRAVTDVVFSADGQFFYSGGEDQQVKIWKLSD